MKKKKKYKVSLVVKYVNIERKKKSLPTEIEIKQVPWPAAPLGAEISCEFEKCKISVT